MTVRLYQPKAKDSLNWRKKDYKFACCDCNLVHRVRFAVKGSVLSFEVWRDNRATAALRRHRSEGRTGAPTPKSAGLDAVLPSNPPPAGVRLSAVCPLCREEHPALAETAQEEKGEMSQIKTTSLSAPTYPHDWMKHAGAFVCRKCGMEDRWNTAPPQHGCPVAEHPPVKWS